MCSQNSKATPWPSRPGRPLLLLLAGCFFLMSVLPMLRAETPCPSQTLISPQTSLTLDQALTLLGSMISQQQSCSKLLIAQLQTSNDNLTAWEQKYSASEKDNAQLRSQLQQSRAENQQAQVSSKQSAEASTRAVQDQSALLSKAQSELASVERERNAAQLRAGYWPFWLGGGVVLGALAAVVTESIISQLKKAA